MTSASPESAYESPPDLLSYAPPCAPPCGTTCEFPLFSGDCSHHAGLEPAYDLAPNIESAESCGLRADGGAANVVQMSGMNWQCLAGLDHELISVILAWDALNVEVRDAVLAFIGLPTT
jgi:hypothetical protein